MAKTARIEMRVSLEDKAKAQKIIKQKKLSGFAQLFIMMLGKEKIMRKYLK